MKRNTLFILAIAISLFSRGQAYTDSLTLELSEHFQSSNLPGFSVAIVNEHGVLYQNSFGYANKESQTAFESTTIQNIGSVSKTVVGLALVKAIEDDLLTMDTKINDLLPFQVTNPFFKDSDILIRHLATHTSSILDTKHYGKTYVLDDRFVENENIHEGFLHYIKSHETMSMKGFLFNILNTKGDWFSKKNFLKTRPGTENEYSNLNAALTAYIIEIAAKMSFEEYTKSRIFEPLEMTSTGWHIDDEDLKNMATPYFPAGRQVPRYRLITYPDGGLLTNTNDMSKYLREIIKAYAGNSTYLKSESAQLMLPGDDDENRAFWGMGTKSRNIGHGGSDPGAQADLQFNADRKVGRIILSNVNAEDNDVLWKQYRGIHEILAKYENKLAGN
ncbi:MAG: beta-lactamase family protein [Cyclobacteriaceae bacterium]